MQLVTPDIGHKELWQDYNSEFAANNERTAPGIARTPDGSYETFLQTVTNHSQNINIPSKYVPSTTFFLINEQQNKLLGIISIRHYLNEMLLNIGGHIGYGIAPSQRRRGYATKMLALALEKCREMGLNKALVTCNKDNTGSAKTILKNGGILEDEYTEESGNIVQRYWIDL